MIVFGSVVCLKPIDYVGWFGSVKRYEVGDRLPCVGAEDDGRLTYLYARSVNNGIHHVYTVTRGSVEVIPEG